MSPPRKIYNEGCIINTWASLQCEFDMNTSSVNDSAGNSIPFQNNFVTGITSARRSLFISTWIAAKKAVKTLSKKSKELFQTRCHFYLDMFKKSKAQCLAPRCKCEFRVKLPPETRPWVRRVIPLSVAKNVTLEKRINDGCSSVTIQQTTSPWGALYFVSGMNTKTQIVIWIFGALISNL